MNLAVGFATIAKGFGSMPLEFSPEEVEQGLVLASMTTVFVAPPALVIGRIPTAQA